MRVITKVAPRRVDRSEKLKKLRVDTAMKRHDSSVCALVWTASSGSKPASTSGRRGSSSCTSRCATPAASLASCGRPGGGGGGLGGAEPPGRASRKMRLVASITHGKSPSRQSAALPTWNAHVSAMPIGRVRLQSSKGGASPSTATPAHDTRSGSAGIASRVQRIPGSCNALSLASLVAIGSPCTSQSSLSFATAAYA